MRNIVYESEIDDEKVSLDCREEEEEKKQNKTKSEKKKKKKSRVDMSQIRH